MPDPPVITAWPRNANVSVPKVGKEMCPSSVAWVKDSPGCGWAQNPPTGTPAQSGLSAVRTDFSKLASSFPSRSPRTTWRAAAPKADAMLPLATRGCGLRIFRLPLRPKKLHGDLEGTSDPVDQSRSTLPPTNGAKVTELLVNVRAMRAVARSAR